jgi:murein DD-endopeptidase MepM/ murein hydrolase activator NlpD
VSRQSRHMAVRIRAIRREGGLARTLAAGLAAAVTIVVAVTIAVAPVPDAAAASSGPRVSTMLPEPVATPALCSPPASTAASTPRTAPTPGTGLWYWPVGKEDFGGYSGWLDSRGSYYHVAQDMPAAAGHAVYAIGDGVVWKSRMDAGGYGPGGSLGGVMIIVHTTATGGQFRALYGHISGLRYKEGQKVTAGAVIATVNGCAHVHFSIHPGTHYRDGNMYAGHVPRSWSDYGGFVDPVKFLKTHPRLVPYVPPAVRRKTIVTTVVPQHYGAADGAAYWTEEGLAGTVTFRYDLANDTRRALTPDEVVPPFDAARYQLRLLQSQQTGFSVGDRMPVVTAAARHETPLWRAAGHLAGVLTNDAGAPFAGGRVRLERRGSAGWVRVATSLTASDGRVGFAYAPPRLTMLRLVFLPPAVQPAARTYLTAASVPVALTPHVRLSTPVVPSVVRRGQTVAITGLVTPRHAAGFTGVSLVVQHLGQGVWTTESARAVVCRDDGRRSSYRRLVRPAASGSWRVRAVHDADGAHARTLSRWRAFSVK